MICWAAALLFSRMAIAPAATITATVTDDSGRTLADAVVVITNAPGTPAPRVDDARLASAIIDQKGETFVPSVVVIHTGGSVTFRNSDEIRHHVYSFAPIRRFEMVQAPRETSAPIRFDQPGSAAIGCNIHDHMTAHIYVTDAPWAMVTNALGQAVISDIPAGRFIATVWHPRLRPRVEPPALTLVLATENSTIAVTIPVLPPRRTRPRDY